MNASKNTQNNNDHLINPALHAAQLCCAPEADMPMVDIQTCLQHHIEQYYADLDGAQPTHLHQMMLSVCEKPLLQWVMDKTRNNQSLASEWLGINRATLRKKLQQYDLL